MKDFDNKKVVGVSKREWSEPQMTQLGVKETEGAVQSSATEGAWIIINGETLTLS